MDLPRQHVSCLQQGQQTLLNLSEGVVRLGWEISLVSAGNFQILPSEKSCSHYFCLLSELPHYSLQSEIEKLKAENDRLKSESQGSGCSRAPSQVSISASPRQSMGLSQHSLNLTESTSLGEWPTGFGGGTGPRAGTLISK